MPRWSIFLLFLLSATLVVGGVHYYIYRRLVIWPGLPSVWITVMRVVLLALALSIPLSFIISRLMERDAARLVVFPIYVWMGLMLLLFFSVLGIDLVRGLLFLVARISGHKELVSNPERRLFLARLAAGTVAGTVMAAAAYGMVRGLSTLVVKRFALEVPRLPAGFDGFTIAQITDLHLGPMRGRRWMEEVVARTNALKPDLVAITGDLVDGTIEQLSEDVEPVRSLRAPHGVFFVTGNHEYFVDVEGWMKHLKKLGVRVLRNERVAVERNGSEIDLFGIDDHDGARLAAGHGPDLSKAMKGHDPSRASVLLAHQPKAVIEAAKHKVGLVLSGHTHGGQIWPWMLLVRLQQPYIRGLHDHEGTKIYVSDGTGFWGPPIRLGTRAEITFVTLRSPKQGRSADGSHREPDRPGDGVKAFGGEEGDHVPSRS